MTARLKGAAVGTLAALAAAAGAVWPYDQPADVTADELLKRVSARYDAANDFRAELTVVASSALGESITQAGTLFVRQPNLFRLEYQTPTPQTVIFDGAYMYVVTPGYSQVLRYEGGGMGRLLNLARALDELQPAYDVALAGATGGGTYELHLTATTGDAFFPKIVMWVDREESVLTRADLYDAAGNTTSYRFSAYRFDVGVPAANFRYEPAPGTEVVDAGSAVGP